ncbi:13031_t:CDS:10, partial [Acaulospora morrowiae]
MCEVRQLELENKSTTLISESSIEWIRSLISDRELKSIDSSEFEFIKNVYADGSYGLIGLYRWNTKNQIVVLKHTTEFLLNESLVRELKVYKEIYNPEEEVDKIKREGYDNIIRFYGISYFGKEKIYKLVLEYARDDLRDYMKSYGEKMNWKKKIEIVCQISNGLCFLHSMEILHRDLNTKNILVQQSDSEEIRIFISDFGSSKVLTHGSGSGFKKQFEKMAFVDPHVLLGKRHNKSSDIYSFGVVMWEVSSSGREPFKGEKTVNLMKQLINMTNYREKAILGTPRSYMDLYQKCWQYEQSKRPTAKQINDCLKNINLHDVWKRGINGTEDEELEDLINRLKQIKNNSPSKLPQDLSRVLKKTRSVLRSEKEKNVQPNVPYISTQVETNLLDLPNSVPQNSTSSREKEDFEDSNNRRKPSLDYSELDPSRALLALKSQFSSAQVYNFSAELNPLSQNLNIICDYMINGQQKVEIPGLQVKCEVEGARQAEIDLLNLLQSHEKEIFDILPKNIIGIGITFEKSYQEPSIVLYINKPPAKISEEMTGMLFEILQRPPEDVVIRLLSDEDDSHESNKNAECNKGKNIVENYNSYQENRDFEDIKDNEDSGEKGSNSNKRYISNGGNGDEPNGNMQNNDGDKEGEEFNKKNEDNGKESDGDGGGDPSETNGVRFNEYIKASAYARISDKNVIQEATIQFDLRLEHPQNEDDRLEIEIPEMFLCGGDMLYDQSKDFKAVGYYPVEAKVAFTAISTLPQGNEYNLINIVYESIPLQEMGTQKYTKLVKKEASAGVDGITPKVSISFGREKTISEDKVPIVTIQTLKRGGTGFSWRYCLNNEEKEKKYSDYKVPTTIYADFEYEKDLVKKFEIRTVLVLALKFKKGLFSIPHVTKFPERLRFSLSVIIMEEKIQEIFKEKRKCIHKKPLNANKKNNFEDSSKEVIEQN